MEFEALIHRASDLAYQATCRTVRKWMILARTPFVATTVNGAV